MAAWHYYLWAGLLLVGSVVSWLTNLLGLPGNWVMVGGAALFAWLVPVSAGHGQSWAGVVGLLVLAVIGEGIEFAAGALGAAKSGASRRAVLLACVGALLGGITGAIVGVPVPLIGSMIAALFGSAIGSFAGAYLGQQWSRKPHSESMAAGQGAFFGRLWGTAGKLLIGAVMLVVLVVDLFAG